MDDIDYSGYEIVKTTIVMDSLNEKSLHINVLKNGTCRLVVVYPKKDGIDEHIVFEIESL